MYDVFWCILDMRKDLMQKAFIFSNKRSTLSNFLSWRAASRERLSRNENALITQIKVGIQTRKFHESLYVLYFTNIFLGEAE